MLFITFEVSRAQCLTVYCVRLYEQINDDDDDDGDRDKQEARSYHKQTVRLLHNIEIRTDGPTDGQTDRRTDVDSKTVRMHSQSHGKMRERGEKERERD